MTTVDGTKNLQIPPGSQPGEKIKMSKMGVPDMNRSSVRGDHVFLITVQIPKNLRFEFVGISFRIHPDFNLISFDWISCHFCSYVQVK